MLEILDGAGVNIEYMYAILGNKKSESAYMIFRVDDNTKAADALNNARVKILDQSGLSAL